MAIPLKTPLQQLFPTKKTLPPSQTLSQSVHPGLVKSVTLGTALAAVRAALASSATEAKCQGLGLKGARGALAQQERQSR